MKLKKKFAICFLGWIISFLIFILLLIITNKFATAVFFFRACVISMIAGFFAVVIWIKYGGGVFEAFLIYASSVLLLISFTVFGPTFIDRSISYHMVFFATENGELDINMMKEVYVDGMIQKRIDDALNSGMIYDMENNVYGPTKKAKIATAILESVGNLTNTMGTYEEFKKNMEEK